MGMGYEKFMAFTPVFPRNQLGGSKNLWVMTGSTVTESYGAGHLCNRRTVAPLSQCTTTIVCDNRIRGLGYESLYVYK